MARFGGAAGARFELAFGVARFGLAFPAARFGLAFPGVVRFELAFAPVRFADAPLAPFEGERRPFG